MSKYNRKFKLLVVRFALENSSPVVARRFNVTAGQVRYWTAVYRIHGSKSFRHKELPYTQQFKLEVIETMNANNWSANHTSACFDLSSSGILSKWIRQYTEEGKDSLLPQKKGRQPMKTTPPHKPSEQMTEKELREELEYLRAENAFLKKMEALTQQKKKKIITKP